MAAIKRHSITFVSSALLHNGVATGVDIELLFPGDGVNGINSVLITNTQATADVTVSLFIQDAPETGSSKTFFLINLVVIPAGVSLLLNEPSMFSFSNSSSTGFGLYATVGSSDTLDILIN
tara:strand:+ start:52 stop:414 length:363 start_codon:yes stop_codon:yes gene_type:complete